MKRGAGILMPISSLPSKYGIGCFDKCAFEFIDFLSKSGQKYWQILPIGPTGFGDSPYQSFSAFAGNPYFISLDILEEEGYLLASDLEGVDFGQDGSCVDYEKLYNNRFGILRKAFLNFDVNDRKFIEFCRENSVWLDDFALFMSLKKYFNNKSWLDWDDEIKNYDKSAVERYKNILDNEAKFYMFIQYMFFMQWKNLKQYANKNGIEIIGDIPIYVALDSSDVWANKELFQFKENKPIAVAGCPPDGFSEKGQLWGNPLYEWDFHKKSGYKWWIERIKHSFNIYDVVRIDHFRGFDEYYSIKYGADDATIGSWQKGPGYDLFKHISDALGEKNIIAEDLGFITDNVKKLLKDSGFPGMKVLEFAFDSRDENDSNDYLPHLYSKNCVAYTGTHDNQTLVSWFKSISENERRNVRKYLSDYYTPDNKLNYPLICLILRSSANLCIIPIQDYLELDDSARINEPSTMGKNWKWRINNKMLSDDLANKIKQVTRMCDR